MAKILKTAVCLRDVDDDDVVIAVLVQPRASRNEVVGLHDGRLKVRIRSAPINGKANRELVRFLARTAGSPAGRVTVVRGKNGRRKEIHIAGMNAATLEARLKNKT